MWPFSKPVKPQKVKSEFQEKYERLCVPGTRFVLLGIEHVCLYRYAAFDDDPADYPEVFATYVNKIGEIITTEYGRDHINMMELL